MNVPMSTVTRLRTPVPSVPERRERDSPPRPRGEDRERRFRRRRIGLIAAVLTLLIAAAAVALALSGSGEAPPATGAAEVVPADVLAYVHLSTDGSRPAVRRAEALARRFPDYPLAYAAVINRLTAIVGGGSGSVDFGNRDPPVAREGGRARPARHVRRIGLVGDRARRPRPRAGPEVRRLGGRRAGHDLRRDPCARLQLGNGARVRPPLPGRRSRRRRPRRDRRRHGQSSVARERPGVRARFCR